MIGRAQERRVLDIDEHFAAVAGIDPEGAFHPIRQRRLVDRAEAARQVRRLLGRATADIGRHAVDDGGVAQVLGVEEAERSDQAERGADPDIAFQLDALDARLAGILVADDEQAGVGADRGYQQLLIGIVVAESGQVDR